MHSFFYEYINKKPNVKQEYRYYNDKNKCQKLNTQEHVFVGLCENFLLNISLFLLFFNCASSLSDLIQFNYTMIPFKK